MEPSRRHALAAPFVLIVALSPLAHAEDAPKRKPPKADASRPVQRRDGKCYQHPAEHCPPGVHCNPGPPQEVECPSEAKSDGKK